MAVEQPPRDIKNAAAAGEAQPSTDIDSTSDTAPGTGFETRSPQLVSLFSSPQHYMLETERPYSQFGHGIYNLPEGEQWGKDRKHASRRNILQPLHLTPEDPDELLDWRPETSVWAINNLSRDRDIIGTNDSSSSRLPAISTHHLQPHSHLRTLHLNPYASRHIYTDGALDTPRAPVTTYTPASTNTLREFSQMGVQTENYQTMPARTSQQQSQQSRFSTLRQSSTATSYTNCTALASRENRTWQDLRPMPHDDQDAQPVVSSPSVQPNGIQQWPLLGNYKTPTRVVGSQGRRGILPSAPGRPAVGTTGTTPSKDVITMARDDNGRYPCPHCTKTYLHKKHLKRHLLRRKLCQTLLPIIVDPNKVKIPETALTCV